MKRIVSVILAVLLAFSVMPVSAFAASKLPAPKVSVSCVASTGKIKVSWSSVSGAAKYQVYRATSKNGSYSLAITKTTTSYINTSAAAGKTYYYKVRAVAKDGTKGTFSEIKYRTCDLARPVVKGTLNANTAPKLKWSAIDGAKEYKVYRATTKNGSYKLLKVTASTGYTDTSANSEKKYYYKVKAVCSKSAADSAYSTVVLVSTRTITVSKTFVTLNPGETVVVDVTGCGDSMTCNVPDTNIANGFWGNWYEESTTIPLTIKAYNPGTVKFELSYSDNESQICRTIEVTVKDPCNGHHTTKFGYCSKCGHLRTELCETANQIIGKCDDGNTELNKAIEYLNKGINSSNPEKSTQYQKALKHLVNAREAFNEAKKLCKSYAEFSDVKAELDKIVKELYCFTEWDSLTYEDLSYTVDVIEKVAGYETTVSDIVNNKWIPILKNAGYTWD